MTKKFQIAFSIITLLVTLSFRNILPQAYTQRLLFPAHYTTLRGNTGGQPVTALRKKDQSGIADNWTAYVEFTTPATPYRGYLTFTIPADLNVTTVKKMTLRLNYKGPTTAVQRWTWSLYDWSNGRWIKIGDNQAAPAWYWKLLSFTVPAPYERYLNSSTRQMRLLITSNNATEDMDLDYAAIILGLPTPNHWQPNPVSSWQIQYSGTINTSLSVDIYNLDGFDTDASTVASLHQRGIRVMCYFNAGAWEDWRPDKDQFPAEVLGNDYAGWPGEKWLDIRRLDILGPLMRARMQMCKDKGFDGIDPDNLDGYLQSTGFPLTYANQLAYNRFLANTAHNLGLGIGLKNDLEQIPDLVAYFDWAINESCFEFQECNAYQPFLNAGKAVFNIEYNLALDQFCTQANALNFNSIKKHRALDAYRESCR